MTRVSEVELTLDLDRMKPTTKAERENAVAVLDSFYIQDDLERAVVDTAIAWRTAGSFHDQSLAHVERAVDALISAREKQ